MRLNVWLFWVAAALVATGCDGCGHSSSGDAGPVDAGPLGPLEQATGVGWTLFTTGAYGAPIQLVPNDPPPPTIMGSTTAVQAAETFLQTYGDLLGIGNFASELSLVFTPVPDQSGLTWVSFQQAENGVAVYQGRILVAFDTNGSVGLVWSGYVPGLQGLSVTPAQTQAEALAAAEADLESQQADAGVDAGAAAVTGSSTPELAIYPRASSSNLAFYVQVASALGEANYWIDAQTGAVIYSEDALETVLPTLGTIPNPNATAAPGISGVGSRFDTKTFTAGETSAYYYMQQQIPPKGTWLWVQLVAGDVVNGQVSFSALPGADDTSSEVSAANNGTTSPLWSANTPTPGVAVDAYAWVYAAEQWYQEPPRSWASVDNNGVTIPIFQFSFGNDNAGWDTQGQGFKVFPPLNLPNPPTVALDVMGHEYTHGVIDHTLRLPVSAINEGLADEFGQYVEADFDVPASDYVSNAGTLGEGVVGSQGIPS